MLPLHATQSPLYQSKDTILSGFRKAGIIGTASDDDSDVSDVPVEEEAAHCLPSELAELFRSDTEEEDFVGFSD